MKRRLSLIAAVILLLSLLGTMLPACKPLEIAESYVAVVPKVLHPGSTAAVSVTLLKGQTPAAGNVEITLLDRGKTIATATKRIQGKGTIDLNVPDVKDGDYEIRVKGSAFDDKAAVKVANSFLIFLETDKPIYKPGQTIHVRLMTLNSELKPVSEQATIEILDAKGIKLLRKDIQTDDFGMVTMDFPLSDEPNLGAWKLTASTDKAKTQLDVTVDKYVLPKYEVKVDLPKEWFLVNEQIKGTISAEYSFGKPVKGELEIKATRYVGKWEQYTVFTKEIDGKADFTLPAVGYVAGVPAAGGLGNVSLEVTVKEKATGYEEKTTRLLTVAQSPLKIQIIPESIVFKPGLPYQILFVTETPDNKPLDAKLDMNITYTNSDFQQESTVKKSVNTVKGKTILEVTPPAKATAMTISVSGQNAFANKIIQASYSPSGNFINLEQTSEGTAKIGQNVTFKVNSTKEAMNFYYEVIARDKVVFTDFTSSIVISFQTTRLMAPSAKLVVYQILPNSEVAADYLPFNVEAAYPQNVQLNVSTPEAKPGDKVNIDIKTGVEAKIGLVAVDKSVYILAENRLNLQQVFDQLEKLYMDPQAELHEVSIYPTMTTLGAKDVFNNAGVVVLSNNKIPDGKQYKQEQVLGGRGGILEKGMPPVPGVAPMPAPSPTQAAIPPTAPNSDTTTGALTEVSRIRQYFPETWIWQTLTTDARGNASVQVEVPDSITTWMLRAVAISKQNGLGIAENSLKAFQPFFIKLDLPYSVIRGEEFPLKVSIYNYLNAAQDVQVQIDKADWFDLLDSTQQTVKIGANEVAGASFRIKATKIGINDIKVTVRGQQAADAVIDKIIVAPEGVAREVVDNLVISAGVTRNADTTLPSVIVSDSGKVYITLSSSYLTQTLEGMDKLIQMPFGCGEQNMINFAPDVFITKYLKESGQLKPEIMAKAEKMMITGYQRELTYRHSDGSFSAFGDNDKEGSLWLTAFVLKSFAQAKGIIYMDQSVLDRAQDWIVKHQNSDGSFDAVGLVIHQDMMGGVKGKTALTAYIATALMEAGEKIASAKAVSYLESKLNEADDPYTFALTTYALEFASSVKKNDAHDKLMKLAKEDENGLHWGSNSIIEPVQPPSVGGIRPMPIPRPTQTTDIEATGYAALALVKHGDALNAGKAAKWLVSKRNAYGGFGSTQDTVVALQALTTYATGMRADVDLTVNIKGGGLDKTLKIDKSNFDVLQVVEAPVNEQIQIMATGKGEVMGQVVRRYNLPATEQQATNILKIDVSYDSTQVEVNDLVTVNVGLTFNPPVPAKAGMIVLDVSVPTGFTPVTDTIVDITKKVPGIKRYDIAGRKVIFYVEDMNPGDKINFSFKVQALYPVKAKGVASEAYSYYQPELKGETLGPDVTVK